MIRASALQAEPRTEGSRVDRFDSFIGENWLMLIALHPLARVLILADSSAGLAGFRVAESFLWFSFWIVEACVIALAVRRGFRAASSLRVLDRTIWFLLTMWLTAVVIGTVNADFLPPAIRSAVTWLVHGLFALSVWHLAIDNPAQFERAFQRFVSVLPWATAVAGTVTVVAIYSIGLSSGHFFARDVPGFSHIRHSGYIFAPAMAMCLGRLATAPREPWIPLLLFSLNLALCLWFGSRGPMFGLIAGLVACGLLFADFRRWAFWIRAGAATIVGSALSVLVPSPDEGVFNAVRRIFVKWDGPRDFTTGRTEFWKDAARLIADRPLFGYGGEQFQYVSPVAKHIFRHPHDFLLQVVFDWGAIGGGAFLALLALWGGTVLKSRQTTSATGRIAAFGALCMLGFAVLDGILFYPFTIAVTLLLMLTTLAQTRTRVVRLPAATPVEALIAG